MSFFQTNLFSPVNLSSKSTEPSGTRPSLVEPQSTGGETAEVGFDFQTHVILQRLPSWLAREGFVGFTRESMGDTEAKFYVPGEGEKIEFLEVKNYQLTSTGVRGEIKRFIELEAASPATFSRYILVCNGLPQEMKPFVRMLDRIRKPSGFYAEDSGIAQNSWEEFVARAVEFKWSADEAKFLFQKVYIEADLGPLRTQGPALFAEALGRHLPRFVDASQRQISGTYQALDALIGKRINAPISRREVEEVLQQQLPTIPSPPQIFVEIVTGTVDDDQPSLALTFRWQRSFSKSTSASMTKEEWNHEVTGQLNEATDWIKKHRRERRIHLVGTPRLSQAFAVGAAFSAVAGYELDFAYRQGQLWSTDSHPNRTTPLFKFETIEVEGTRAEHVAVSIGILRYIREEVDAYLASSEIAGAGSLHIYSDEAIFDAEHANMVVRTIKDQVASFVQRSAAKTIHLFMATPAPLALFLGHRINAISKHCQCYERADHSSYVATANL